MRKQIVFHPVLFALFPTFFLYSFNKWLFSVEGFLLASLLAILLAFFVWLPIGFLLKDYKKGAIIASLFLLLFFSHGILDEIRYMPAIVNLIGVLRVRIFLLLLGAVFLAAAFFVVRTKKDLRQFTSALNATAVFLVFISLFNIGLYEYRVRSIYSESPLKENGVKNGAEERSNLPDIYHIILDAYGSADTLWEHFGYSNDEFYRYLKDRGFYIADKSTSNYGWTLLSFPSFLNMNYMNSFSDIYGEGAKWQDVLLAEPLVEDNAIQKFLKSKGYTYIHFDSGYARTENNRNADVLLRADVVPVDFLDALLSRTALKPFPFRFKGVNTNKRIRILFEFEKLREVPQMNIKRPVYAFMHVMAPHTPYALNRDCGVREENIPEPQLYTDQVTCLNKLIRETIDVILEKSEKPPIILMHSDHGPPPDILNDLPDYSKEQVIRGRMRNFSAYYLPNGGDAMLYESISLVNMFRVIFNFYFDASYEILPDKNYYSDSPTPFLLTDVTDIVQF